MSVAPKISRNRKRVWGERVRMMDEKKKEIKKLKNKIETIKLSEQLVEDEIKRVKSQLKDDERKKNGH